MMHIFWPLFTYCVLERLGELVISKRNQRRMKSHGFVESETKAGMQAMIFLHLAWYISLCIESIFFPYDLPATIQNASLVVFILAQGLRFWTLSSLGGFWNISVLTSKDPSKQFVSHGPYRFIRHPNYLVVIVELLALPLVGDAPRTAILFSVANGILLKRRISLEEQHLFALPGYSQAMGRKPRFLYLPSTMRPQ
jgi:methyltransferase